MTTKQRTHHGGDPSSGHCHKHHNHSVANGKKSLGRSTNSSRRIFMSIMSAFAFAAAMTLAPASAAHVAVSDATAPRYIKEQKRDTPFLRRGSLSSAKPTHYLEDPIGLQHDVSHGSNHMKVEHQNLREMEVYDPENIGKFIRCFFSILMII